MLPKLCLGETSSGKSTLMNLFLGDATILPAHTLSCTSTICEIRYGEKPETNIVLSDGRKRRVDYDDRGKYMRREGADRAQKFEHEYVEIFHPTQLLKVTFN